MPYSYHKSGDEYVVTKKGSGKEVGRTDGNKEALRKYLAALHMNTNEAKNKKLKEYIKTLVRKSIKELTQSDKTSQLAAFDVQIARLQKKKEDLQKIKVIDLDEAEEETLPVREPGVRDDGQARAIRHAGGGAEAQRRVRPLPHGGPRPPARALQRGDQFCCGVERNV